MSKVLWKESRSKESTSVHAEVVHLVENNLEAEHEFCVHFYPKRRLPAYISVCMCIYTVHMHGCDCINL